jgi:glucose/arabinose dehydrogenase
MLLCSRNVRPSGALWSAGAVVATHGSWDRQPPRSPALLWMPWDAAARTLEPARVLVTGFQEPNGQRWGRPVDAVPGPDHALYVSDDTAGAVYCMVPPLDPGAVAAP